MRKLITLLIFMGLPALGMASGGDLHLDQPRIDLSDRASLQRGAKVFIENCLNCHSANYMRYGRMAKDLEMSEEETRALMYTSDKLGELMTVSIDKAEAKVWFGTAPPDLTVIARARKPAWIYTYLRAFYVDPTRPFGVNNTVFKDVAMPHVLARLQGLQQAVFAEGHEGDKKVDHLELVEPGVLSPEEYDALVNDLVNFIVYMGEPAKLVRYKIGVGVLIFLGLFSILLYLLKREYWRDVH